ncbi:MAG: OmpA family protein [Burkholderiales bacterium]|nr:OmpA family protein [Burkholderiales bacterium]
MKTRSLVFLLAAFAMPAAAESGKVLQGEQITESALIEALTPTENIRTRSIRVTRDQAEPAQPAKASLLIIFDTNSANLTPRAKHSLDAVGRALKSDDLAEFKFVIEGHADPRGGPELNQRLSQARAESVRQYLVRAHGVEERRMGAVGKGDSELMNSQNPIAAENRRVTIVNTLK